MLVKALKSFTTADLKISPGVGCTIDIDNEELVNKLIADGFVEKYEEVHPAGKINITQNGEVDVTNYKIANVDCGTLEVIFNGNNTQKESQTRVVVKGNKVDLLDEDDFTVSEGKKLAGWATTQDAELPDINEDPYTPTENVTLYAVWKDENEEDEIQT